MPTRSPARRRVLLAIAGGPLAAALLLLAGELLCRAITPRDSPLAPRRWFDPGTKDGREVLVPSPHPPLATARFWHESIQIEKPPGALRVLCLGDSTVYGHPFDPPAAFADWLAVRLPRLLDGVRADVWNLGVNHMSSESVRGLARELEPLRPDVVVVYVGHNDFLERWIDASCRPISHRIELLVERSFLLRRALAWLPARPVRATFLPPPRTRRIVDDLPIFRPEQLDRGARNYEENLAAIVAEIRAMGALSVLCVPVSDVVDTPPELSSFSAPTPAHKRESLRRRVESLREKRVALDPRRRADPDAEVEEDARARLGEADDLVLADPGVALFHYERGRLLRLLGRFDEARAELFLARDLDGHPIRVGTRFAGIVREVARRTGALLVDPWPLFERAAPGGLPGQDGFFVDYVHPDLVGHRLIAEAILRALAGSGAFGPADRWRFGSEPNESEYEALMGLSRDRQADTLARRGMFALGQGYLDPSSTLALRHAENLFELALSVWPDCALAHAGRGALALVRGDSERALADFARAGALDPASLSTLVENYQNNENVRALFEKAGLTVREGRIERR
jgi:lysophospholipase L1-like esterase